MSGVAQSPGSRKVGIVCHSFTRSNGGDYEVKVYMVDLDVLPSQPCGMIRKYTPAFPAVRFRFPWRLEVLAVCVLNRTVYLFGGHNSRRTLKPDRTPQSAHRFALSEGQVDCHVKPEQLCEISNMHHNKGCPTAIPTPDGTKIMVFGTYFLVKDSSKAFELYCPGSDRWEQFPGFPRPCRSADEIIQVKSYSFIGESRFFVVTDRGSFALDLDGKVWAKIKSPKVRVRDYFLTARDRYVLIPGMAFDFGHTGGSLSESGGWSSCRYGRPCSLSTFGPTYAPDWATEADIPRVVRLGGWGEVENTCVIQVQTDRHEGRILLDICDTHLPTLTSKVRKCVSLLIDFLDCPYSIDMIYV